MLHLHFANRFETLADDLAGRLSVASPGRSVFSTDDVIVPSAAVTRRLIVDLAQRHGICTNVRFSYLAGWLWEQAARWLPNLEPGSPLDADVLGWRILAAFADERWSASQPRLGAWLAQADATMRHELAARMAKLFEQYLTYRPEWLQAWSRGETVALGQDTASNAGAADDQRWQSSLWQRLTLETGSDAVHPALALLDGLAARGIGLAGKDAFAASVQVMCLPTMPPVHLALLQRLSVHMDVHVHALNPCREFWFDVADRRRLADLALRGDRAHRTHLEEGNRLLAAWGRQTQSQLGLLVDAAGTATIDDARYTPAASATLLGRLQDAVLDLSDPAPGTWALATDDRSVEVHVCHSLTRELEVLHDRLLGLFAQESPPAPGDILVVTPDLDTAAPLVDAVFGTAPRERHVPYAITGRARAQVNAPARALLDLLALLGSRFVVSATFGLLQQAVVARRFDLADDELDQVRQWLMQSGVHWALNADHRTVFDLPAQARHSFADGLDRLFLGYALPAQIQAPFDDRLPAGNAQGARATSLGALWQFVDALGNLRDRVAQPLPPSAWPTVLLDALDEFVQPADAQLEDLREVRQAIATLARQWRQSELALPLSLDVVRAALQRELDDPARGGVPTGAVTFAAMNSLRNVPFRVVCAIGLDDGAFPTSTRAPEFDLMALATRPGDRQRRVDERNLFLDLLLAARERVHLSYTGRSVRDNAVLPPSVLVSELLEYLVPAVAGGTRARLVVEHPLQPFAEGIFDIDADPRLRSFRRDYAQALQHCRTLDAQTSQAEAMKMSASASASPDASTLPAEDLDSDDLPLAAAAPFISSTLPAPGIEWHDVPIDRLAAFFRNPCRFLLEQRLGVELRRDADELQDNEPFLPDVSGHGPLIDSLLPALLDGLTIDDARRLALAGTHVPPGGFGKRFLERELNGLQAFAAEVREHTRQPVLAPHEARVDVTLDGTGDAWHVHAGFSDLRARGLLQYRYADRGPNDYLGAWLRHLLLCATAPPGVLPVTTGIARDGRFFLTECEAPRATLETLLGLYRRGLREPLAFFPKSAWAYVDGDQSVAKAIATFRPGGFALFPEGGDAGYRLALRGRPDPFSTPALDDFAACARAVFEPLRACLELE